MTKLKDLKEALDLIRKNLDAHIPSSKDYYNLNEEIIKLGYLFNLDSENGQIKYSNEKKIFFPFKSLGTICSSNFFNLNELIFSSYYCLNQKLYKRAADIGSCLGFHGLIMSLFDIEVDYFEPDPATYVYLEEYVKLNNPKKTNLYNMGIYKENGEISFNRLNDNQTGSHIIGSKDKVYGSVDVINIQTKSFSDLISEGKYDLIKLDIEGAEGEVFDNTFLENFDNFPDMYIEIHNENCGQSLLNFVNRTKNLNIFSQKNKWNLVKSLDDMPLTYKDGAVFVTKSKKMNWE